MNKENIYETSVIAIDPTPRGFAYAVLSDSSSLTDWGHRTYSFSRTRRSLKSVMELVDHYLPDQIVVKNIQSHDSLQSEHNSQLLDSLEKECADRFIPLAQISRDSVHKTFRSLSVKNKNDIASAVTNWFPELANFRPPRRKFYQSEKEGMNIFDAVALALTFYYRQSN